MALDSRRGFGEATHAIGAPQSVNALWEGTMQPASNLSPAQLFESARRAVQDGQLALAEQFLRHVVAVAPQSAEGAAAQTELGRLMRHRAAVEGAQSFPTQSFPVQPNQAPAPSLQMPAPQPAVPQTGPGPGSQPGYIQPNFGAPSGQWSELTPPPARGTAPQLGAPGQPMYAQPGYGPPGASAPALNAQALNAQAFNAQNYGSFDASYAEPPDRLPDVVTGGRKAQRKAAKTAIAETASDNDLALDPPRSYRFGRFLAAFVGLCGWLAVLGGLGCVVATAAALLKLKLPLLPVLAIGFLPAGQIFVGGLALILIRHMARAAFDAASHAYAAAAYAQASAARQD